MKNAKTYYEVPTQVKFKNADPDICDDKVCGGIAYQDFVICGECGATLELDDVIIIEELSWATISEEIKGD